MMVSQSNDSTRWSLFATLLALHTSSAVTFAALPFAARRVTSSAIEYSAVMSAFLVSKLFAVSSASRYVAGDERRRPRVLTAMLCGTSLSMALGAMCDVGDGSALLLPLSLPLPLPLPLKLAGARLLVGCFAAADVLLTSWILDSVGAARGGGGEQAHRTVPP